MTRAEAARAAGVTTSEIRQRPDLLRIGGTHLEEVYHAFQFDQRGVRRELGLIVQDMKRRHSDIAIADWLVRPNPVLVGVSPLRWLEANGRHDRVFKAAYDQPPVDDRSE